MRTRTADDSRELVWVIITAIMVAVIIGTAVYIIAREASCRMTLACPTGALASNVGDTCMCLHIENAVAPVRK